MQIIAFIHKPTLFSIQTQLVFVGLYLCGIFGTAYLTSPLSNHMIFRIYRGYIVRWLSAMVFWGVMVALRPLWNPAGQVQHFQMYTFV